MGQKLQDGKKVLWMSLNYPHSESHPVQTIHPTDLGLLPTLWSSLWPPAQGFSGSWDARKHVQEKVELSCNSRKSELVKLQYNPNDHKWGTFGCTNGYCYITIMIENQQKYVTTFQHLTPLNKSWHRPWKSLEITVTPETFSLYRQHRHDDVTKMGHCHWSNNELTNWSSSSSSSSWKQAGT